MFFSSLSHLDLLYVGGDGLKCPLVTLNVSQPQVLLLTLKVVIQVNIWNDKAELYEKIVSVNLLVIDIIDCKLYTSRYCLMQGSCAICSDFFNFEK